MVRRKEFFFVKSLLFPNHTLNLMLQLLFHDITGVVLLLVLVIVRFPTA